MFSLVVPFHLSMCSQNFCIGANLDQGSNKNITFTRRYLDPNRVTYEVTFFCPSEKRIECLDSSIQRKITRFSTLGRANPLPRD